MINTKPLYLLNTHKQANNSDLSQFPLLNGILKRASETGMVKEAWGNAALRVVRTLLSKKAPQVVNKMRASGIAGVKSTPALSALRPGATPGAFKANPDSLFQRIVARNPSASPGKLEAYRQRMLANNRSGMSTGARSAVDDVISVYSDPNSVARVGHLGNNGVAYGEALKHQPQVLGEIRQARDAVRAAGLPVPANHGVLAEYGFPNTRMNTTTTKHLGDAKLSRRLQANPDRQTRILHPGDRVSQEMLQANSKPWLHQESPYYEHVLFEDTMSAPFTRSRAFAPVRGGKGSMSPMDIAKTSDGVRLYSGANAGSAGATWDAVEAPLSRVRGSYWTSPLPSVGAPFAAGPDAKLLFRQAPFNDAARKGYTTYFDKLDSIQAKMNIPRVEPNDLRTFGL